MSASDSLPLVPEDSVVPVDANDAHRADLRADHGTAAEIRDEEALLAQAVGGWRGMIDSALPSAVFLIAYVVSGNQLTPSIWAAVIAGVLIALLRLARRESLQQVISGFIGVAISAFFASKTGRAEAFYLPGLLLNAVYATVLAASALIGHPIIGYVLGGFTGDITGWRSDVLLRRAASLATWIFVATFSLRLIVQIPLYLAGSVGALGVARLVMGWPLYLLAIFLSYRVIARARTQVAARDAQVSA